MNTSISLAWFKRHQYSYGPLPVDFLVVDKDDQCCYRDQIEETVTCHWIPRELHHLEREIPYMRTLNTTQD